MSSDQLELRPVTEADLPFLIRLRRRTMREAIEQSGIPYDEAAQQQRIEDRLDVAQIIILDGQDIGLLKVDRNEKPWKLIQIQIQPEYQRQRLGVTVLRKLLAEAARAGTSIELNVLKNNPAKRLYKRLGFRVVKENERHQVMTCNPLSPCLPGWP